ncbi:uncharacterized protein LOC125370040 [Ricinus communis]|uniref:uncharacterized protein LOC125370040 n=1 Tax=Ricinus communis TaxID=3988 RepID=UPI00201AC288|nr:uncharacterized protein LOC125370040 [Ricinus communis]
MADVSENEIKVVVFSQHPNKSPGIDGMNPAFFQHYWDIVKNEVVAERIKALFVHKRLITDNIMLSFEVMHYISRRRQGKEGYATQMIMLRLGCANKAIQMIMACVTSVRYFIMHGNEKLGPIYPSRGLRQGDPLSPYCFILCVNWLSNMLNAKAAQGMINGVQVCRRAPVVTHLFFANDSLLFFKANIDELGHIKAVLDHYKHLSSQMVNFAKSAVFFSPNVKAECKSLLLANLDVAEMGIEGDIETMLNSFWWGSKRMDGQKGISWSTWDSLSRPKEYGGMGFRKIQTNLPYELRLQPVCSLLKPGTCDWDQEILNDLFSERDKNLINSIILIPTAGTDQLFWFRDAKGKFSVKDVYCIQQPNFSVLHPSDVAIRRRLWKLNIAAKCKVFMWRALTNRLPVRTNLVMRKVTEDSSCPCFFGRFNDSIVASIVVIYWSLWTNRNDVVWNRKKLSWRAVASRASSFLFQWGKARKLTDYFAGGDCLWQKPATGKYKLNVDASSSVERGKSGAGFVLRDDAGAWITGVLITRPYIVNPDVAEAWALKEALSRIHAKGMEEVQIETDCLRNIELLEEELHLNSYLLCLLKDCQDLIRVLNRCNLIFVYRSANTVAHMITKAACSVPVRLESSTAFEFVTEALLNDLMN